MPERTVNAEFPQGPWPLRLWGRLCGWLLLMARLRYYVIPMMWLISGMLLILARFLAADYLEHRARHPGWTLTALAAVAMVLLLMIVAAVRRYTVFVPAAWATPEVVAGEPNWPILVQATATFRPAEGWGRGIFVSRAAAQIFWQAEPGTELVVTTWVLKLNTPELHRVLIPTGSQLRTGSDHTGGVSVPALAVQATGQTIYLRFTTLSAAQQVAGLIRQGSHAVSAKVPGNSHAAKSWSICDSYVHGNFKLVKGKRHIR